MRWICKACSSGKTLPSWGLLPRDFALDAGNLAVDQTRQEGVCSDPCAVCATNPFLKNVQYCCARSKGWRCFAGKYRGSNISQRHRPTNGACQPAHGCQHEYPGSTCRHPVAPTLQTIDFPIRRASPCRLHKRASVTAPLNQCGRRVLRPILPGTVSATFTDNDEIFRRSRGRFLALQRFFVPSWVL